MALVIYGDLNLKLNATTFVYLRGDSALGYNVTTTVVPFIVPSPPTNAPVSPPVNPPLPINSTQGTAQIRIVNAAYEYNRTLAGVRTENRYSNGTSYAYSSLNFNENIFGSYFSVPSRVPLPYTITGFYDTQEVLTLPTFVRSSIVYYNFLNNSILRIDEFPIKGTYKFNNESRYYRIVNTRKLRTRI